jgi:hypothetical protein
MSKSNNPNPRFLLLHTQFQSRAPLYNFFFHIPLLKANSCIYISVVSFVEHRYIKLCGFCAKFHGENKGTRERGVRDESTKSEK